MFKISMILTGIIAGLCILALPIWILGVPGTENNYAKGWKIGFEVIISYPFAWLVNFVAFWVIRSRIDEGNRPLLETISASIALVIFVLALVRLVWAFKTMS